MDLLDIYLEHARPDAALSLHAIHEGGNWGSSDLITERIESNDPAAVKRFIEKNADKHQFFATSLIAPVAKGRGDSSHARIAPVVFADFDTADGRHKGARPTKAQVSAMLQAEDVVPMPSIIVDTGGGYHAYWLLAPPSHITDDSSRQDSVALLAGLNLQIKNWSEKNGWKYEQLKDLARVLRIPGTKNHKYKDRIAKQVWPRDGGEPKRYLYDQLFYAEPKQEPPSRLTPEFEPLDSKTVIDVAFKACSKVAKEWGEDGSGYLLKLCRQCVRAGCNEDQAFGVVTAILAGLDDYPTSWTKKQILQRYADAMTQSEVGEAIDPNIKIAFFNSEKVGDTTVGISQDQLLENFGRMKFDLVNCRGELQLIQGLEVTPIKRETQLFALIQSKADVHWSGKFITKGEFMEAVKMNCPTVEDIELTPHIPPIPRRRYLTEIVDDGNTKDLEDFLDLFNPATPYDRQLLLAAVSTICWGGPPGCRPAFSFESAEEEVTGQIGTGKSTTAEIIASVPLLGATGCLNIRSKTDWKQVLSNIQDSKAAEKRVILADNLRGILSGQEIESMITAREFDGHRMYQGYSGTPNYFTWFITANGLQTSEDMSKRIIPIKLNRPVNNPGWARRVAAIDYPKVLSGVAAFFKRTKVRLDRYTRWQTWEDEILSRCAHPNEIAGLISTRTRTLSGIDEDALDVRDRVLDMLRGGSNDFSQGAFDASVLHVWIPSQVMANSLANFNGRRLWTPKASTIMVKRLYGSSNLLELDASRDTAYRGFIWRGIAAGDTAIDYGYFGQKTT